MLASHMRTSQCHLLLEREPFDDKRRSRASPAALRLHSARRLTWRHWRHSGELVLVTGGMGALGETICTRWPDAGYKMAVTYSPGNTHNGEWVAGMNDRGCDVLAVLCNVSDFDSCSKAVAEAHKNASAIDVPVNKASITRDMTFKKMDKVNWDTVMRTNSKIPPHIAIGRLGQRAGGARSDRRPAQAPGSARE